MKSSPKLEAIFELLDEGVLILDRKGNVEYLNFIAAKMLGFSKKTLLKANLRSFREKIEPQFIDRCLQLAASCEAQKSPVTDSISIENRRKMHLDLIAAPRGETGGAVIVMQDNSNHYRILEMGKDFVANASHELRTPITIIRGFAETLQDLPEISEEMLQDITDKIIRNCQRMDYLVKSLLMLSDIESLPLSNLQNCNMEEFLKECKEDILSAGKKVDVKIMVESKEPMIAHIAPDLFSLAVLNLLENAVKYSKSDAQITITLKNQKESILIYIADQGEGIPPDDVEHVFERFYTVNKAHSRKLGGAGLGLSIVKTIVEKHGGTISVASKLGEGSSFTIALPHYTNHS